MTLVNAFRFSFKEINAKWVQKKKIAYIFNFLLFLLLSLSFPFFYFFFLTDLLTNVMGLCEHLYAFQLLQNRIEHWILSNFFISLLCFIHIVTFPLNNRYRIFLFISFRFYFFFFFLFSCSSSYRFIYTNRTWSHIRVSKICICLFTDCIDCLAGRSFFVLKSKSISIETIVEIKQKRNHKKHVDNNWIGHFCFVSCVCVCFFNQIFQCFSLILNWIYQLR